MKSNIVLRLSVILAFILIVDYVLMAVLGCASCLFKFDDNFYCGTFCVFGKIILLISAAIYSFIVYSQFKLLSKHKDGQTS